MASQKMLIEEIANKTGYANGIIKNILKAEVEAIAELLEYDGRLHIYGLGVFKAKQIRGFEGYDITKDAKVYHKPHVRITFTQAQSLKDRFNKDDE